MPSFSKSQAQEVGEFVDRSVYCSVRGAPPLVGVAEKFATGALTGVLTVM